MSYSYRGRYTEDYAEYQRWKLEGEADEARRSAEALKDQVNAMRTRLSNTEATHQREMRAAARQQALLEERQRQSEAVTERLERRQQEYEQRAERQRAELERDLRSEINAGEQRVTAKVEQLRQETNRQVAALGADIRDTRNELRRSVEDLRGEIQTTRIEIEQRVAEVRRSLEHERDIRRSKEQSRVAEATAIADWIDQRLSALTDLDNLGLSIEKTRTEQQIERIRERVRGGDGEMAAPVAETAFASYQTAYLESERRLGVIEGVADHVDEIVIAIEGALATKHFETVFHPECADFRRGIDDLKRHVADWRNQRRWTTFEHDRFEVVERANRLMIIATELKSTLGTVIDRLTERENRLKAFAAAVETVMGPIDKFETQYANPADPKTPRLLRAHVGAARIDIYVELDGTYNIDAYGFPSSVSCAAMAERMGRVLEERFHVAEQRVDATNPQAPSITPPAVTESWRARAKELRSMVETGGPAADA